MERFQQNSTNCSMNTMIFTTEVTLILEQGLCLASRI